MVKIEKLFLKDSEGIIAETNTFFNEIVLENGRNEISVDMSKLEYVTAIPLLDGEGNQVYDEEGEEQWTYIPYEGTVTGDFVADFLVTDKVAVRIDTNSNPPVSGYSISATTTNMRVTEARRPTMYELGGHRFGPSAARPENNRLATDADIANHNFLNQDKARRINELLLSKGVTVRNTLSTVVTETKQRKIKRNKGKLAKVARRNNRK